MSSVILRIAARSITPLLTIVSLILLLRGHNAPGGGFIGGLLAAAAIAFYAMAMGPAPARRKLRLMPRTLIGVGLLVALTSGLPAVFAGRPYLSGQWWQPELPLLGAIPLGTPLWFDVGVYIAVIGFVLTIFFALFEAEGEEA